MITWNHKANKLSEVLGITDKRADDIRKALGTAAESEKTTCNSEVIAMACKLLKPMTEADYLILGYYVGVGRVLTEQKLKEQKNDLVKLMEGLTAILKKDDDR